MSLFWSVVAINAGGLVVAALVLALSPATISPTLTVTEGAVLAVGTLALIGVNVVLLSTSGGAVAGARAGAAGGWQAHRPPPWGGRDRGPPRGPRMTVPLRTRILLADDHTVVRRGLAQAGMRDRVELTRWAIRHGLVDA